MGLVAYISALFLAITLALRYYVPPSDRAFCYRLIFCLLPIQVVTLYFMNSYVPFVPSETDTFLYYEFSQRDFDSLTDYVDVTKTSNHMYMQFGGVPYTHILTIIHQFVGDSLFFRKMLALAALWPLGFAWYAISRLVAGPPFARTVLAVTVALPTLWYPFCVLYRDLLTAALHSIFLASVLLFHQRTRGRMRHASVLIVAALLLFALRPATIYINAAVIAVAVFAGEAALARSRRTSKARFVMLAAATVAAGLAILIITDERLSIVFRLDTKATPEAVERQVTALSAGRDAASARSLVSLIPRLAAGAVLFIGSEPTVVSSYLDTRNPEQLRGMMNGPWFLFGAPFAALAILTVVRQFLLHQRFLNINIFSTANRAQSRVPSGRWNAAETVTAEAYTRRRFGLWVVAGYSLMWFVICVVAWDWTRWRLPAVPALVMLAVWQFLKLPQRDRTAMAFAWGLAIVGWRLLLWA